MNTTLKTACFTIDNGQVVEGALADFSSFIEQTTRPNGVGPKYYATTVTLAVDHDEENQPVENDVWVLAKWATWGGPQVVVRELENEKEAREAAEETYVYDILHNSEFVIHLDRSGAEQELRNLAE